MSIDAVSRPVYGMGIVAENTPLYFDCASDAGLAVAGLNFPGYAQYESAPVQGKTNVCAWEFPLWVVANFHTVDEVKAALADGTLDVARWEAYLRLKVELAGGEIARAASTHRYRT